MTMIGDRSEYALPNSAPEASRVSFPPRTDGAAAARIEARGVRKVFETQDGPVIALDDMTLTVEPGEFCVIVGPSGCGKTTFLRMLAGLDEPTDGEMIVAGRGGSAPSNAMVFQGRSVFPWLTVQQNIAYGLSLRGVKRAERRAITERLLSVIGLERFGTAFPHQLSEGMRQRVAIARALAVDPDLLLMDEPFGALDAQTRTAMQDLLLEVLAAEGKTVMLITHSVEEAVYLSNRIIVMTARPTRIREIIDVPFAYPRQEGLHESKEFGELRAHVRGLVMQEYAQQAKQRQS
jgi:NitT/TauT family transport system ATP-binding protein